MRTGEIFFTISVHGRLVFGPPSILLKYGRDPRLQPMIFLLIAWAAFFAFDGIVSLFHLCRHVDGIVKPKEIHFDALRLQIASQLDRNQSTATMADDDNWFAVLQVLQRFIQICFRPAKHVAGVTSQCVIRAIKIKFPFSRHGVVILVKWRA